MKKTDKDKQDAIDQLREWLKPGDTVYTILEHVSRSGMSRTIRVVVPYVRDDGRIDHLHPNYSVAKAIGARRKGDGIVMGGCGMDMGFALVYELSSVLYGHLRCEACGKYPSGEYRTIIDAMITSSRGADLVITCEHCQERLSGGYQCLGKGKCPSNYHVNHRDTIQCPGTEVYNPDGPNTGHRCYWQRGIGWVIPSDETDPARLVNPDPSDEAWIRICPTCNGTGRIPNPEGPERFDLLHTDGYALRHRWL
jgi:hypothetical protein